MLFQFLSLLDRDIFTMKLRDILFVSLFTIAAVLSGLLVCLLCTCSLEVAGGSTETTNTKIAGMLYNPKGSPAANAKVLIVTADHIPLSRYRKSPAIVDSALTDSSGNYSFDSLPGGYYNVFGDGDSGISYADSIFIKNDTGNNLPPDTLKAPGSQTGVIRLQPEHDSRTILILVFGSQKWTIPADYTGNFTLANMAEGTYTVRFLTTLDDYVPLDANLTVRAGINDILSDTLYMTFTGIPTPTGLKHRYDTSNQIVTLSWNAADTSLIKGYYIYRKHTDSSEVRLNNTPIPDTLFIDSLNGGPPYDGTYFYYVTAVDKNYTEGPKSALDSILIKGNCQGWTPKTSIAPTMEHFALTIEDTLYCVGGVDGTGAMQTLMKYNAVNDTWENLAPIPKPRTGASAGSANGKIFYFGGEEGVAWISSNFEYNPLTNLWSKKANECATGKNMSCCENDNNIYIVGGERCNEGISDSVHIYNPGNDYWNVKSSMKTRRTKLTACSVNGKIYSIGGYNGSIVLAIVEEYDSVADQWTTKSPMPTARMSLTCCVLNGKIYALGGFDGSNILSTVEMYDPATDRWTAKSPMPTPREALSAAVVNGKILAIGGRNGSEIIGTIEVYNVYGDDR